VFFTIAAVATLALSQQTDTTVAVRQGMRLDVDNFGGGIVVRTWNQSSVRVQATHGSRDQVSVTALGSTVSVRGDSRRGPPREIDYDITVPAWMELYLHGTYVDIEVTGSQAPITAETVNGEIKVDGGSGNISLKSVSGEVTLENAKGHIDVGTVNEGLTLRNISGDISVETVSGDVTLEGIESASVEVNTTNGDLEYDGTIKDGGHYTFSTTNGEVTVSIPEKANVTVSVSTFNGEFDSSFPVSVTNTTKHRFAFTIGTGSAKLEIESFNGDINLRRPGMLHERQGSRNRNRHNDRDDQEDN
jgi:putative adhesin